MLALLETKPQTTKVFSRKDPRMGQVQDFQTYTEGTRKVMLQRKLVWAWMLMTLYFFVSLACDPNPHPEGNLHILDGHSDTNKEPGIADQNSEATPETISQEALPPEEITTPEDARSIEPSTNEATQPEATQPEALPEMQLEPPLPEEIPALPEKEPTPPERSPDPTPTEPRTEGPPPDPVGTPCQVQGVPGTCMQTTNCASPNKPVPGYCPGPAGIQCCVPQTTTSSCDPNAKPQPNTGITAPAGLGGCPAGMTRVSTFCIDRWEAFLVEVLPSGQTQPWSPYFNPGTTRVRAVSAPGAVPQGYISGDQAKQACIEAGKRLCTDQEWLRACQGPSGWTYPYGNSRQNGVCNDARSVHPAVEYFNSSQSWVYSKIQHQCLNQLPQSLAKTGDKTGCLTAEGVYDMMGNLHEWTADPTGTFRGGFYVDTYRNGNGCLYRTTAHNTLHWDYSTGFRCCAN